MIRFALDFKWGIGSSEVEIVRYPAGEFNLKFESKGEASLGRAYVTGHEPEDLILLNLFGDLCRRVNASLEIFMPYFPSAREDRGNPLGVKVYADMVNMAGASKVTILDPHSDVTPALVNNCHVISVDAMVPYAIYYNNWLAERGQGGRVEYVGVVAPDGGAIKRTWGVAQALKVPMYQASKHRDVATGKLSGFSCETLPKGRLLFVDDICDGGGTFIGLADACHHDNLDLWVTHGIFTGDNLKLEQRFGRIFTTESFKTPAPQNTLRIPMGHLLADIDRKGK